MTYGKPLRTLSKDGSKHVTDEFYNVLTSGISATVFLFGVAYLLYQSYIMGKMWHLISFSIYGFGVLSVFITSTLHHKIDSTEKIEHILKQFDYFAISIMIAGTFTPFCLILLRDTIGLKVLVVIWTLAFIGIFLKAVVPHVPKWITTGIFLGMGWMAVVVMKPIYLQIHLQGIKGLFFGGVFFSVGALIYLFEKPNPFPGRFGFHEIWHIFVFLGAISHYSTMLMLLPAK